MTQLRRGKKRKKKRGYIRKNTYTRRDFYHVEVVLCLHGPYVSSDVARSVNFLISNHPLPADKITHPLKMAVGFQDSPVHKMLTPFTLIGRLSCRISPQHESILSHIIVSGAVLSGLCGRACICSTRPAYQLFQVHVWLHRSRILCYLSNCWSVSICLVKCAEWSCGLVLGKKNNSGKQNNYYS